MSCSQSISSVSARSNVSMPVMLSLETLMKHVSCPNNLFPICLISFAVYTIELFLYDKIKPTSMKALNHLTGTAVPIFYLLMEGI